MTQKLTQNFSELLSAHIHEKNVRTHSLAQHCGMDRSNMYKLISGKRKPSSPELVEKICDYLQLTPPEKAEMKTAYQIELVGAGNYYRRQAVWELFDSFHLSLSKLPLEKVVDSADCPSAQNIPLFYPDEVKRALSYIVTSELKDPNGQIDLLIQPDFHYLMDLLTAADYGHTDAKIHHILCFNNNSVSANGYPDSNVLHCLKEILPLYGNSCRYESFYYYGSADPGASHLSLFPYMVLTKRYGVCFWPRIFQTGWCSVTLIPSRCFMPPMSAIKRQPLLF